MNKFAKIGLAAFAMVAAIGVSQASAAAIPVPNYLFNSPSESPGNYSASNSTSCPSTAITDWCSIGGNQYGVQNFSGSGSYSSFPDGGSSQTVAYTNNDEIYLNSTSDPSFNASDDFLHVGTYTLTLYVGNRSDYGFSGNAYVALVANGAVDAQTSVSAPTAGTFTKVTLTDVVTASDANLGHGLEIALNGIGVGDGASNGQQVDWTDVVLTYTPEPLSLSIFGAGLVLTAVVVGRRKKKMPERRMA